MHGKSLLSNTMFAKGAFLLQSGQSFMSLPYMIHQPSLTQTCTKPHPVISHFRASDSDCTTSSLLQLNKLQLRPFQTTKGLFQVLLSSHLPIPIPVLPPSNFLQYFALGLCSQDSILSHYKSKENHPSQMRNAARCCLAKRHKTITSN